jgi:hypothetical protein
MLSAQDILTLSAMRQREVYVAVRLAAMILKNQGSIADKSAKTQFAYNDLVWAEIKAALKPIFKFASGRIDFYSVDDMPNPWDLLTPAEIEKRNRDLEKMRAREAVPLTPVQEDIYALGGFTRAQARSFYFAMSTTYGHAGVEAAVAAAKDAKPGDPKAYIIACLRRRAQTASEPAAAKQRFPTKIRKFEKPVNPEANAQTMVGWEHPLRFDAAGAPVWKEGVRSMIYRLRTGELKFETPPAGAVIPTLDQDPGCIIT